MVRCGAEGPIMATNPEEPWFSGDRFTEASIGFESLTRLAVDLSRQIPPSGSTDLASSDP